jgi:hypothetical protein
MGLKNLFSLDRYSVYTGSNYLRQLVDGIVKSGWFRQVFGLLRVRFRQVFGLLRDRFRQVSLYLISDKLYYLPGYNMAEMLPKMDLS